jgi:hypothetical protein
MDHFLGSPSTVDIIYELDKKFSEIVTDQLDARSRQAIIKQQDPATMTTVEVLRIRKAILHRVYGKFEVYMH